MRFYYLIWVDLIVRAKSRPGNESNWPVMTMVFMTAAMAVDFAFLMTILERYILNYNFYELQIPILPQNIADPLSFVILFAGPPLLINYLLIFRNRRYEKLIEKYEYHDGKLAATAILLGLFIPVVTLFVGMFYYGI
jgi:hypothetical protein